MERIQQLISQFNLSPHPEGGFYAETYRSKETISKEFLPRRFAGKRSFATAIYFLLPARNFSAFHRIASDETWHFYEGDTLLIYVIHTSGTLATIRLGKNLEAGDRFQATVPAGCWFASRPEEGGNYSFVGCTVAPGFDFRDFEMGDRGLLTRENPSHENIIWELTRV